MLPAADSAGQPFEGRSFTPNPFAADTGEADVGLKSALTEFHARLADAATAPAPLASAWVAVIDAMRTSRLLSPLIAQAGDFGVTGDGLTVEKTQELSVPHLQGPDGRAVAPVFTDVSALAEWNRDARPIPVDGPKAALAAASDGLELMVLNPGSVESVVFRRSAIRAIATGEDYCPPWADGAVGGVIAQGVSAGGQRIVGHHIAPGDPAQALAGPEVLVVLGVSPGLGEVELRDITGTVSAVWADSVVLGESCDGLGVKVVPA